MRPYLPRRVATAAIAALGAVAVVLAVVGPFGAAEAAASLRQLADARGIHIGAALAADPLRNDATYRTIAATEFNAMTPENSLKWASVEPNRGQFTWANADAQVAFGNANGQKVRGHTLVWHSQYPGWVNNYSGTELRTIVQDHVTTTARRYAGKIYAWDVVNEPFEENGTRRQSIFQTRLGESYIADAFRWARAADPAAKLYLNDYNVEGINAKSDAMYNLVRTLRQQGVPIDGVGLQAHFILGQLPSTLQQNIARFAALGVDVAITELDIRMPLPTTTAKLAQQATDYTTVVKACLAVSRCVGITVWGFTDRHSWVPAFFPGQGAALPWDANYNPKPAYTAIATALGGTPTSPPATTPPRTTAPATTPPGTTTEIAGTGSGRCLDVPNGSQVDGTRVQLGDCSGNPNQKWTATAAGELRSGGKCLDAFGRGRTPGTVVDVYTCNGGANQRWTLNASGTITGVESGLCLDAFGGGTANGTPVVLWTCTGGANQRWTRR
ncbi:MAG TPA: endo-1,4-beta-xylanase [Micromonosporaceae bacterium]|nr:endo-1,4-beta-xylanase [Micromonosporaceae bacterium]